MEQSRISKDLQLVHRKVMLGQSESTVSSSGSCDTSGKPYQYAVFSRSDDDAESMICATKYTSISEKNDTVRKIS